MKKSLLLAALLSLALTVPANAQAPERSLLSLDRLSLAAGLNYEGFSHSDAALAGLPTEFAAGVFAGYALVPHLKLAGGSVYGFESKRYRSWVGLRLQLLGEGGH